MPRRARSLPVAVWTAVPLGSTTSTYRLAKRVSNHATHLLALLCCHENRVEALGDNHGVGESVDGVGGSSMILCWSSGGKQ